MYFPFDSGVVKRDTYDIRPLQTTPLTLSRFQAEADYVSALRKDPTVVREHPWRLTLPAVQTQHAQREPVHEATYKFVELVFGGRYARRHFRVAGRRG
jgi:hypothetical protein